MRQMLPVPLALGLLLSACGNPFIPVDVPASDPNVLQGEWRGQLTQQRSLQLLHSDARRVYWMDGEKLEVSDAQTGALLAQTIKPSGPIAWRSDGTLVVARLEGSPSAISVLTYDPVTLAQKTSVTRPYVEGQLTLSSDGETLSVNPWGAGATRVDYSTRTDDRLPVAAPPTNLIQQEQDPTLRWAVFAAPSRMDMTRDTFTVQNVRSGKTFTLTPRAPVSGCTGTYGPPTLSGIPLADGQEKLLLTYPDGLTEIRSADGQVEHSFSLAGCARPAFKSTGMPGVTAFEVDSAGQWRVGLLDVTTGAVTRQLDIEAGTSRVEVSDGGVLKSFSPAPSAEPMFWSGYTYRYQSWTGTEWTVPTATSDLTLNVTTTWQTDTRGTVSGTATLDSKTYQVQGEVKAMDARLKAQTSPRIYMPVLYATLNVHDSNGMAGQLALRNFLRATGDPTVNPVLDTTRTPVYSVDWVPTHSQPYSMNGTVQRP